MIEILDVNEDSIGAIFGTEDTDSWDSLINKILSTIEDSACLLNHAFHNIVV